VTTETHAPKMRLVSEGIVSEHPSSATTLIPAPWIAVSTTREDAPSPFSMEFVTTTTYALKMNSASSAIALELPWIAKMEILVREHSVNLSGAVSILPWNNKPVTTEIPVPYRINAPIPCVLETLYPVTTGAPAMEKKFATKDSVNPEHYPAVMGSSNSCAMKAVMMETRWGETVVQTFARKSRRDACLTCSALPQLLVQHLSVMKFRGSVS